MKKRKLEDRVFKINPIKDGEGKYIPFCNYHWHRGVLVNDKHKVCERRDCNHYLRLYISYKTLKEGEH